MGPLAASRALQSIAIFESVQVSPALIEQAIDRSVITQRSFRDALSSECLCLERMHDELQRRSGLGAGD